MTFFFTQPLLPLPTRLPWHRSSSPPNDLPSLYALDVAATVAIAAYRYRPSLCSSGPGGLLKCNAPYQLILRRTTHHHQPLSPISMAAGSTNNDNALMVDNNVNVNVQPTASSVPVTHDAWP
mmetsp:Transcript_12391/g.26891  ORF Transcript_12391/g.26891 Transcript_12391/m.26891 type:complete len:122 (-) Transcript_12391:160-525(-)